MVHKIAPVVTLRLRVTAVHAVVQLQSNEGQHPAVADCSAQGRWLGGTTLGPLASCMAMNNSTGSVVRQQVHAGCLATELMACKLPTHPHHVMFKVMCPGPALLPPR
jgi:hypothetical protein